MGYHALLFCPDEKTARVVTQVLSELEFGIEPCTEPFAAVKRLMAQHFDALVVDCENEQNAALLFKSARNSGSNQSSLTVAVVEGQDGVAKAFRIGANLVVTKPINVEQAKGTLRVARGLLRKADAAKPAGAASTSAEQPAHHFTPVPPTQRPASLPAQQTPSIPAPTASASSAFELEPEPAPPPGPAEAALLEYMPDSVPAAGNHPEQPAAVSPSSKEYPWQPVSKPLAEPMASALRRAAEAAGKAEADSPAAAKASAAKLNAADAARDKESWPTRSMSSGQGAATAPAPAKETPWPSVKTSEAKPAATVAPAPKKREDKPEPVFKKAWAPAAAAPAIEAPTFASLDDARDQEGSHIGGKKTFLVAAIVLLLVATGYFGWTKMHPVSSQPSVQKQFAPAEATPQAASPNQQAATPSTTPLPSAPSEMSELQAQEAEQTAVASNAKTPSPKPSAAIAAPAPATKAIPTTKNPEPIVVKNEVSNKANAMAAAEEPAQPPAPAVLGVGSSADEKAISGIMSTTSVKVPKPVPQAVRVSQGISQGMLLKRVQPVYPQQARQLRLQGAVQLEASIGKDGSITKVKQISGDAVLGRAAVDAVKQWKYKPYYLNDEPVEIQTQITVNFKLP